MHMRDITRGLTPRQEFTLWCVYKMGYSMRETGEFYICFGRYWDSDWLRNHAVCSTGVSLVIKKALTKLRRPHYLRRLAPMLEQAEQNRPQCDWDAVFALRDIQPRRCRWNIWRTLQK
jgi:hypothetical protein